LRPRATKLLEAATEVEVVANMNHEVRPPSNGAQEMTSLLPNTDLDTPQRQHPQVVCNSSEMLLAPVNVAAKDRRVDHPILDPRPVSEVTPRVQTEGRQA
jgi:hypothetical protein